MQVTRPCAWTSSEPLFSITVNETPRIRNNVPGVLGYMADVNDGPALLVDAVPGDEPKG